MLASKGSGSLSKVPLSTKWSHPRGFEVVGFEEVGFEVSAQRASVERLSRPKSAKSCKSAGL